MSQKNLTNNSSADGAEICPVQKLLKTLSGKLKLEIFILASQSTLRFSSLLRDIEGSNKQTLTTALRELEELDLLERIIIKQKPLHIEYNLTPKGKSLIPILRQLEGLV
ncbi:winged helix-turn-helix transcriptional regulator [Chryseobacterium aureum]|uniref:winged helix-turn-helix transcriptional regulator n=1 Tax=Chryseobacterium aureum TaxID=2497456 RepID=UPI000F86EFEA|nr:winged helix-turn-helix transcriptional regulator [Chryseobacterium aureum]